MIRYHDALETRSTEQRAADLARELPGQVAHARAKSSYYARLLEGVAPEDITGPEALARLPVLRKSELQAHQAEQPPFGGLTTLELGEMLRVFQSPGPLYEPQSRREDFWRFARAMTAAGFRPGELIHNSFAYHFSPAGFMFDTAGAALGCPVFPAGTGQSELQVRAMAALGPGHYTGTPSFLKTLLDKAAELGEDVSRLSQALVTAEPCPPSLVAEFRDRGVDVYQCYGTADLGLVAYETEAREGLVADEGVIVEIVRPGTGEPVAEGEVGELLVTTLNPDYPLLRFATGDLSAVLPGPCPTGRSNLRIRGWMGRADQTCKVRGLFVQPSQVQQVVARHPELGRARLVVTREEHRDRMELRCAVTGPAEGLAEAVAETLREVTRLRGEVALVAAGDLPNDGKVIDDQRTFE